MKVRALSSETDVAIALKAGAFRGMLAVPEPSLDETPGFAGSHADHASAAGTIAGYALNARMMAGGTL